MAKVQHDISSHPDTVIILKDPLTQFAIWEIEEFPPHPELPNLQPPEEKTPEDYDMWGNSLSTKSKKKKKTMREEAIQEQPPVLWFNTNTPEVGGNSLEPESYNATAEAIPVEAKAGSSHIRASGTFGNGVETVSDKDLAAPLGSNLDHSANNDAEPIGPTHMNSPTGSSKGLWEEDGIYFHVSSRHLMEASGHFRRMMSGGKWKEGIREENGFFYTKTKEWDNEAFLILMNVFHLRNSRVPSSVSLEMMAKIAILVDFYECWEAIDIYKTIWVQNLKSSQLVPVTYGRDLVMWICVTQVFGLHVEFKQATKVAMMQSKDTIQALELPIYPKIVDAIEHQRSKTLEKIVSSLHSLCDKYRDMGYECPQGESISFTCGSALLGALTKQLEFMELLLPRPEAPFLGWNIRNIYRDIKKIQSPVWRGTRSSIQHSCDLNAVVVVALNFAVRGTHGLNLSDFRRTTNDMENDK